MTRCNRENINYVVFILFYFFGLLSSREAPTITKGETLRQTPAVKGAGEMALPSPAPCLARGAAGPGAGPLLPGDTGPGHHPQVRRGQLTGLAAAGKDRTQAASSRLSGRNLSDAPPALQRAAQPAESRAGERSPFPGDRAFRYHGDTPAHGREGPFLAAQDSMWKVQDRTNTLQRREGGCLCLFFLKKHSFCYANLPFEGIPESRFILISSITQQVFIHHVCLLLNLQSQVMDLVLLLF